MRHIRLIYHYIVSLSVGICIVNLLQNVVPKIPLFFVHLGGFDYLGNPLPV